MILKKHVRILSRIFGSRGGSGSIDRAACQNSDKQVLQFLSMTAVTITKAFSLSQNEDGLNRIALNASFGALT